MVNNIKVKEILDEFSKLKEVEGILLGGSQVSGTNDGDSDYDIYIYLKRELSIEKRRVITDKYCKYMELNNTFWETEDDGVLKDGTPIEIIYRNIDWIEGVLNRTLVKCEGDTGYTTCFWSNFKESRIIYDKNGELKKLQDKYNVSYPQKLKENIIKKNYPLLKLQMPAYYHQIEKALKREDFISVNHRVAALLGSYFDIIFAINEKPHPGEKKLMRIIRDNDLKVPKDMELNVNNIIKYSASKDSFILLEIDLLVKNLDVLLKDQRLNLLYV